MFESSNGFLLDLFNGTQGVSVQICNTFTICRKLPIFTLQYLNNVPDNVTEFVSKCRKKLYVPKNVHKISGATLFGAPTVRILSMAEKLALDTSIPDVVPSHLGFFERAVVNGQLIHGRHYDRATRRINYCVSLSDGHYALVDSFVALNDDCFVFLYPIRTVKYAFKSHDATCSHIMLTAVADEEDLFCRPATDIVAKCLLVTKNSTSYLFALPNLCELD
jgi:hypothetical protein